MRIDALVISSRSVAWPALIIRASRAAISGGSRAPSSACSTVPRYGSRPGSPQAQRCLSVRASPPADEASRAAGTADGVSVRKAVRKAVGKAVGAPDGTVIDAVIGTEAGTADAGSACAVTLASSG